MDYRILGHLEVLDNGVTLALGSGKQRALLAALLIRSNQIVATDTLIEEVWGEEAPASAANNLQVLVSRLRKLLGHETILRRGSGYLIRVADGELDVHRFERLGREGREALASGRESAAAGMLREGLEVWRGAALADFTYEPFAAAESARLEELRLAALEDRVDADLGLGRHRDLVPELERLVSEHPYRDRFRAQLILALYRCGRQADALDAYRAARQAFVDELGIEPSPELRALERSILTQDASLDRQREVGLGRGRRVSRRVLMIVAVLVAAAAGTGIALGVGDSGHAVMVRPDSIVVIDPRSARAVDDLPMPIEPGLLAGSGQALWAAAAGTSAVVRIDTRTREIAQTYGLGGGPAIGLAADATGAWASSAPARSKVLLERFEPDSRKATETVELMAGTLYAAHRFAPLALGGGALWASNGETTVFKIDPQSGTVRRRILVDDGAGPIGWGAGDLWAAYTLSDTVTRIDGAHGEVDFAIALARPLSAPSRSGAALRGAIDPSSVLFAFGSIWVGAYGIDSVVRIDPETNGVMTTIPVGDGPHALAAGAGALWVMSNRDATVTKIDPARNAVVARIRLGHTPSSIAFADGRVWVAVQTP